ncbi:MAG: transcription antitermination protein NusB [Flavobacteriales bacterium]|nr:transcription antitermination protein NusB [Flavobacteriales bacterium]MCX7649049.1 transcription antitermination protein NusB [Flavobacteriales bacterium]MDW8432222.1 transcription antitermination protein NusB [Flavobacteriales bacterium]
MLNRHKLRIRVLQLLYAMESSEIQDSAYFHRQLKASLERVYDLYLLLLALLADIHQESLLEREEVKNKFFPDRFDLMPETAFTRNIFLNKIRDSKTLQHILQKRGISWSRHPEAPLRLFRAIRETEGYKAYLEADQNSGKRDRAFLLQILDAVVIPDPVFNEWLDEQYLFWSEDKEIAFGMLARTLENTPVRGELYLVQEIGEGDEDFDFALRLGRITLEKKDIFNQYIIRSLRNWEPDRVAPLDMLLLRMGAAELHAFSEIPIKVTINEILEISKEYSTPKSSQFLNGVLDSLARNMQKDGMLSKSGRGLTDVSEKKMRTF